MNAREKPAVPSERRARWALGALLLLAAAQRAWNAWAVPPLAGYEFINFFGFYAPAGTPDPVVRKLNAAAVQALRNPVQTAKLRDLGFEPAPGSPEQFREFLRGRSKQFAKIIVDANVQIEQ